MLKTLIAHHYYKHVVFTTILICLYAQLPVVVLAKNTVIIS